MGQQAWKEWNENKKMFVKKEKEIKGATDRTMPDGGDKL